MSIRPGPIFLPALVARVENLESKFEELHTKILSLEYETDLNNALLEDLKTMIVQLNSILDIPDNTHEGQTSAPEPQYPREESALNTTPQYPKPESNPYQ